MKKLLASLVLVVSLVAFAAPAFASVAVHDTAQCPECGGMGDMVRLGDRLGGIGLSLSLDFQTGKSEEKVYYQSVVYKCDECGCEFEQ